MTLFEWLRSLFGKGRGSGRDRSAQPADRRKRHAAQEAERRRALVTVGLDFGTSSTKVVLRNVLEKRPEPIAIDFGTRLTGFSRFGYPSRIAIADGAFVFGEEAVTADTGDRRSIDSPKIGLLGDSPVRVDWSDLSLPGHDRALPELEPCATPLEFVVTAYLAHVLVQVGDVVSRSWSPEAWTEALINIDVPVATLGGDHQIAARYQRIIDVARLMSTDARGDRGIPPCYELWVEKLRLREADPAAESERLNHLVPESLAVVQGAGASFQQEADIYNAIVDIGAGTIDVGWFTLVHGKTGERLPFFACGTHRLGCDAIDRALADHVAGDAHDPTRLAREVQGLKAALARGEPVSIPYNGGSLQIDPETFASIATRIGKELYSFYSSTFSDAYIKERNTNRWERLRTIVAGGGSLIPQVVQQFDRHPRTFGSAVELVSVGERLRVKAVGESDRRSTEEDGPFLLAAVGLSFPEPQMPRPIMPGDIEELPPQGTRPSGVYDYECTDLA